MVSSYHNMKLYHAETGCGLLVILLGHHYTLQMSPVDHSTVNFELAKRIIDLWGGKLLSPSHQRMSKPETILFSIALRNQNQSNKYFILGQAVSRVQSKRFFCLCRHINLFSQHRTRLCFSAFQRTSTTSALAPKGIILWGFFWGSFRGS